MQLQKSILKALAYFDLFQYPLLREEIGAFLDQPAGPHEIERMLERMLADRMIFRHQSFYSLPDDPALARRRLEGNRHAALLLPRAQQISRFLYKFPFVTGIAISGSLSKNFASPDADIDYFIITKTNRLWLARTCMHLFKKLSFLVGHQHYYCMNYYIDEAALEIREKNEFTAVETLTLLPVCGNGVIDRFFQTNQWADSYYPNYSSVYRKPKTTRKEPLVKRAIEALFNNRLGERLDNYFLRVTSRRWKEKERKGKRNMKGGRMGLDTGKHYSKPNPVFFQQKILLAFAEKLNAQHRFFQELI